MDQPAFDRYVKERYQPQVVWYDGKANANQTKYRIVQWAVLVLAAVTPVLVAVGGEWQRWSAVVVSALVAIGTTALKTFKYQEQWINYRTTCETLRKEIHFFDARADGYRDAADDDEARIRFVERVEQLISRENTLWLATRRPHEESKS